MLYGGLTVLVIPKRFVIGSASSWDTLLCSIQDSRGDVVIRSVYIHVVQVIQLNDFLRFLFEEIPVGLLEIPADSSFLVFAS